MRTSPMTVEFQWSTGFWILNYGEGGDGCLQIECFRGVNK